jgi:uncharacterized membrane protein YccC
MLRSAAPRSTRFYAEQMAHPNGRRRRTFPVAAIRRAVRAAIVMPVAFASAIAITHDSTAALFAAFGSVIMLLYVESNGPIRQRLTAHAGLVVAGLVLVALGTACSQNVWLATSVTLVVAFCLLFAGIVSSVVAGAQTALLISFMLPVTFPGPLSSTPDRLFGWLIAGAASFIAIAVILPGSTGEPLRSATGKACIALGVRLRAEADGSSTPHDSTTAVEHLRQLFFNTPYRPSGLAASGRILILVIEQVFLLDNVLNRSTRGASDEIAAALRAGADALTCCGTALTSQKPDPTTFDPYLARLRETRGVLENATVATAPVGAGASAGRSVDADSAVLDSLEPIFRAQEANLIVAAITTDVQHAAAARTRRFRDKLVGREPAGVHTGAAAAWLRARPQLDVRSVWLHNSIRGAVGFALAVALADLTAVQHAFWIAFGALAVLRSSAANTGESAIRAMLGTAIGIVLGSGLVWLIGDQSAVTWVLLPIAIVVTGIAPALSFTAGQAAFTVMLLLLFNIIGPSGWATGVIRIEDMAIGCGASVLVAILLWPRGAGPRFSQALADALRASAEYLTSAVGYALLRCEQPAKQNTHSSKQAADAPLAEKRSADDATRRLDDALRQFLAERGAKNIAPTDLASVVLAVGAVRRSADAICELWAHNESPSEGDRSAAHAELQRTQNGIAAWYEQVASALTGSTQLPGPTPPSEATAARVRRAVADDLEAGHPQRTGAAIKLIWTHDHLEIVRRLESVVREPVDMLARGNARPFAWLFGRRARRQAEPVT